MIAPMSEAELLAKLRESELLRGKMFRLDDEALALLRQYRDAHRRAAFTFGFRVSCEGFNGEYPNEAFDRDPEWIKMRDTLLFGVAALPTTEPERAT